MSDLAQTTACEFDSVLRHWLTLDEYGRSDGTRPGPAPQDSQRSRHQPVQPRLGSLAVLLYPLRLAPALPGIALVKQAETVRSPRAVALVGAVSGA
jgi:hypothetical protein